MGQRELGRIRRKLEVSRNLFSYVQGTISFFIQASTKKKKKSQRLDDLNNKHLFPTVLKAEKSEIKMLTDSVSSKNPLPGIKSSLLTVPSEGRRGERALRSLFTKALIPLMRAPPS